MPRYTSTKLPYVSLRGVYITLTSDGHLQIEHRVWALGEPWGTRPDHKVTWRNVASTDPRQKLHDALEQYLDQHWSCLIDL